MTGYRMTTRLQDLDDYPTTIRARRSRRSPGFQIARKVMATPPTVGALATASAIGSGIRWPAVYSTGPNLYQYGDHFTFHRAGGIQVMGTTPDFTANLSFIKNTNISQPLTQASYVVSFYFDGTTLEVFTKGNNNMMAIKVDDEYVSLNPIAIDANNLYYVPITFATRAWRRIDLLCTGQPFGWFYTGPTDTILPAETRGPRCIVIGDSFTGYVINGNSMMAWDAVLGEALGWDDVWCSGAGGTGYLAPGTAGNVKFRDRIQADCIAYNPQIVIIAGGLNDHGTYAASATGAEAALLFAQIRAGLPDALLVVLSPFWNGGPSTYAPNVIPTRDAIKAAALAVGATWIDMLEKPLPSYVTPTNTTLAAAAAANATSVSLNAIIPMRSVIKFSNERAEVKAVSGGGPFTHTLARGLVNAHSSGEAVTQAAAGLWTGPGNAATPNGYGNSDLFVSNDTTHPTQAGHDAIGRYVVDELIRAGVVL